MHMTTTTSSNPEVNGHAVNDVKPETLVMKVVRNRPFVHGKNKAGRWGRPVVDNDGTFYKSIRALSEALKLDAYSAQKIVEKKIAHNGKRYSYASVEQVRAYVASADVVETAKKFKPVKPLKPVNIKPAAAAKSEKKAAPTLTLPFIGVQWPDGSVVVRLASGGQWQMVRDSRDALPVEILTNTRWM